MNIEVKSTILSADLGLQHKLSPKQIENIIKKGELNWIMINEDSPRLSAKIEKEGLNSRKIKKSICMNMTCSGNITIFGALDIKEAHVAILKLIKDLSIAGVKVN